MNAGTPLSLCSVVALVLAQVACVSNTIDTARIAAADTEPGNWLSHGRSYSEQRFSPLVAIDTASVASLGLAWSRELPTSRGAEATPIVVDGVMYVTSAWSVVTALDAKTGEGRWSYDPVVDRRVGAKACCDVVNRGVAVYGRNLYLGVIDGRLVALDRADGTVRWEVMTTDPDAAYTITGAPRAAKGLVFIGNGGAEYGVRGFVSAYDAETGALRWRFYTVPGDPAKGPDGAASDSILAVAASTWSGEWWRLGGGGTVWDAIVYDPEFDQLLIGVGNGSPWNQQIRSPGGGDNLFLSSIVALDASTGHYRWHYQTTPGETWDYTATQPIILATMSIGGADRPVAMQAPKNGFFYLLDRRDGKLLSATPYLPLPPAEATPPGYPIAWAFAVDSVTGRPIENPAARFLNTTAVVRPSAWGGHNWHPMSYSPQTGLVYLPTQELALDYTANRNFEVHDGFWNAGVLHGALPDDPATRRAIQNSVSGTLIAWDPVARREVWRAERRGPWNGGTLATAGGLVFQGTVDGRFLAMNARTGAELWSFEAQSSILAGPVSYQVDGEQYVSVLGGSGSAFFLISGFLLPKEGNTAKARVYTFKVGGSDRLPTLNLEPVPFPKPPELAATPEQYARAGALYGGYCLVCHGFGAISGGVLPDIRKSAHLQTTDAWRKVVVDGELAPLGMPGHGKYLDPTMAELIRVYVARQAGLGYPER
jgi:PQQ-dependent dehydrogenase (methanol/ethanol family)